MIHRQSWVDEALCAAERVPTKVFFPEVTGPKAALEARLVCRRCSVRDECLAYALKNNEVGIWGGKNDEQRKWLRRGVIR